MDEFGGERKYASIKLFIQKKSFFFFFKEGVFSLTSHLCVCVWCLMYAYGCARVWGYKNEDLYKGINRQFSKKSEDY